MPSPNHHLQTNAVTPAVRQLANVSDPLFDAGALSPFLQANQRLARAMQTQQPEVLQALSQGQTPKMVWVGCSDSRTSPVPWLGAQLGDVFELRSVVGVAPEALHADTAALAFGLNSLNAGHVVVVGHTHCGGVQAAMLNRYPKHLESHLRGVRDVLCQYDLDRSGNSAIAPADLELASRLVTLERTRHVARMAPVLEEWDAGNPLRLSAWLQPLGTLETEPLGCEITHSAHADERVDEAVSRALANARKSGGLAG